MSPYITTKWKYAEAATRNQTNESVRILAVTNVILIALAVASAIGFVVMYNMLVSKGYELKDLDRHMNALVQTQDSLARQVNNLRSPEVLAKYVSDSGLVNADRLVYPKTPSAVAKGTERMIE
jgi:cell division protein FtsB